MWEEFENAMKSILQVIRHEHMLEGDSSFSSRLAIATRVPLVDPINVLQVCRSTSCRSVLQVSRWQCLASSLTPQQANALVRMRADENQPDIHVLRDAFAITVEVRARTTEPSYH